MLKLSTPQSPNLAPAGIQPPKITGFTCRLAGCQGRYTFAGQGRQGWLLLISPAGDTCAALPEDLIDVQPIYQE